MVIIPILSCIAYRCNETAKLRQLKRLIVNGGAVPDGAVYNYKKHEISKNKLEIIKDPLGKVA